MISEQNLFSDINVIITFGEENVLLLFLAWEMCSCMCVLFPR